MSNHLFTKNPIQKILAIQSPKSGKSLPQTHRTISHGPSQPLGPGVRVSLSHYLFPPASATPLEKKAQRRHTPQRCSPSAIPPVNFIVTTLPPRQWLTHHNHRYNLLHINRGRVLVGGVHTSETCANHHPRRPIRSASGTYSPAEYG